MRSEEKKQTYFETLLKKVVCCEPTQKPGFMVFKTPEIFTAFSMQRSPGVKIKPLSPGASSSLSSCGAAGVNGRLLGLSMSPREKRTLKLSSAEQTGMKRQECVTTKTRDEWMEVRTGCKSTFFRCRSYTSHFFDQTPQE